PSQHAPPMSYDFGLAFPSRQGSFMKRRIHLPISMALALGAAWLAAAPDSRAQTQPAAPAAAPAPAQAAAPAALKPMSVNGKVIPRSRMDFAIRQIAASGQPDNEQNRKAMLERLVDQEVLAQEAEKKGLAKSSDVQSQLDLSRQ